MLIATVLALAIPAAVAEARVDGQPADRELAARIQPLATDTTALADVLRTLLASAVPAPTSEEIEAAVRCTWQGCARYRAGDYRSAVEMLTAARETLRRDPGLLGDDSQALDHLVRSTYCVA